MSTDGMLLQGNTSQERNVQKSKRICGINRTKKIGMEKAIKSC